MVEQLVDSSDTLDSSDLKESKTSDAKTVDTNATDGKSKKSFASMTTGKSVRTRLSVEENFRMQFIRTSMCRNAKNGNCKFGEACHFAHSSQDLRERPNLDKTKLCVRVKCDDPTCKFAHERTELVATAKFAKTKWCHFGADCLNGSKCRYAHDDGEIRRKSTTTKTSRKMNTRSGSLDTVDTVTLDFQHLVGSTPSQFYAASVYAQQLLWDSYMIES